MTDPDSDVQAGEQSRRPFDGLGESNDNHLHFEVGAEQSVHIHFHSVGLPDGVARLLSVVAHRIADVIEKPRVNDPCEPPS
jgi:hypothetical protein